MNQINNLAFDIMHKEMNPTEQFVYADKIYQLSLQPELNENQQVVLEYLKSEITRDGRAPILNFSAFGWKHFGERLPKNVSEAYKEMDGSQDLQVLAAFAEWGMKEVAE